jgi:thiamine pyridinylase
MFRQHSLPTFAAALLTLLSTLGCGTTDPLPPKAGEKQVAPSALLTTTAPVEQSCKTTVNVLLFPYIPDCSDTEHFSAMKSRFETEFRIGTGYCANVSIADPVSTANPNGILYDSKALASALTANAPAYDIVEVDTVLLGELVESKSIKAWDGVDPADWWPAARSSSTIDGQIWGVPHLMCSEFVIARDPTVLNANTSTALAAALQKLGTPAPNLVGNAKGSWTLPGLYLDAWIDTYPNKDPRNGISTTLDPKVVSPLKVFLDQCKTNTGNGCLSGVYKEKNKDAEAFASGSADALFGYSERLHFVLRAAKDASAIGISPAPAGDGARLLVYTDSLVLRKGCDGECAAAGKAFASYLDSATTMKWYLGAEECSTKVPSRYLIPATRSAFDIAEVKSDRLYTMIRPHIETAIPMPNKGLELQREAMRDKLLVELTK